MGNWRSMKIGTITVAALLSVSVAAPSLAQSAADKATAETLFDEGRRLLVQNKLPEACSKFAESQRLDPAIGTQLNLGDCYERTGRLASAWAQFREASAAARLAKDAKRDAEAQRRAAALEPRLAKLTVTVPAQNQVAGLEITRDGIQLGQAAWGSPAPIDPGEHRVEARAPGKKIWTRTVVVDRGATAILVSVPKLDDVPQGEAGSSPAVRRVVVTAPERPTVAPDAAGGSRGGAQRAVGIALGGVGLVGIGVGAVFGIEAGSKQSESDDHCRENLCDAKGVALRNDALRAATVSTIGFGGGAAALLGGTLLLVTAPSGKSTALRVHTTPTEARLSLTRTW